MNTWRCLRSLLLIALIPVSGNVLAQPCGPPFFGGGFEDSIVYTYNDPGITPVTDDGRNFTRTESIGLDWLDLTSTLELSTDAVALRLADPSDELFGLRFATTVEINNLLAVYGLPAFGEIPGTGSALAFIQNFGLGSGGGDQYRIVGRWPVSSTLSQIKSVNYNCVDFTSATGQGGDNPDGFSFNSGNFLVRPVPTPPAVSAYNDPEISGPTDDGMNFTRVESLGLDWLDLTITLNLSTAAVELRLAEPTDELFGLRFATTSEINGLMAVYGLPSVGEISGTDAGMAFINNFGLGVQDGANRKVGGMWKITEAVSQRKIIQYNSTTFTSTTSQGGSAPSFVAASEGNFLVRSIP